MSDKRVVRIISKIGQAAGVVVDERSGKSATSHDFQRAFASRWARKGISTLILAQMMRHSSASTTESYYVDITSDDISATLHQFVTENPISDTIGDTSPKIGSGGGRCMLAKNQKPPVNSSGGHGIRTRNRLPGTSFPVRPLANSLTLRVSRATLLRF